MVLKHAAGYELIAKNTFLEIYVSKIVHLLKLLYGFLAPRLKDSIKIIIICFNYFAKGQAGQMQCMVRATTSVTTVVYTHRIISSSYYFIHLRFFSLVWSSQSTKRLSG